MNPLSKSLLVITAAAVTALAGAVSAHAGSLVLSGDSNLGNTFNGTNGAGPSDNGAFFTHLLGGGTSVVFQDTTNTDGSEIQSAAGIKSFFGGLAGVTVDSLAAPVTAGDLSGAALYIAFLPQEPITGASVDAIKSFLAGGGNVLVTAEYANFSPLSISTVNALLGGLGSSMSLTSQSLDLGFHTATGGQIASDPLTAGVSAFSYAATTGIVGGTTLLRTLDGTSFIAAEAVVPEPGTWALMLAGLGGLAALARRRPD